MEDYKLEKKRYMRRKKISKAVMTVMTVVVLALSILRSVTI